jgi:formylglycine-generating enzyme required for sulfatase activity
MVVDTNLNPKIERQRDMAERQVALFADRYGETMLDFACHVAFPQMLTTDLVYLLRQLLHEQYQIELSWSAAPELLLSNLCDTAGHDLYGMSVGIRRVLLEKLVAKFGSQRLEELAQWMGEYIHYRLERDFPSQARVFGDPSEWTVLACLNNDSEIAEAIKEQLRQVLAEIDESDLSDLVRLSALVEDHADLLSQRGLQAFKLKDLAQKIEKNRLDDLELEDPLEQVRSIMIEYHFPLLQSKDIEYSTISFEETEIDSGDALYAVEFEIVQVNEQGRIIKREPGRAFVFREPLATDVGLEMVAIPSGKFMMGSPESEHDRFPDESPEHEVTVPPFFMGKYPVTQAQWQAIANTPTIERKLELNPSRFTKDNNLPVENVSWEQAVEFCARLSRETGRDYRLPTEAEWEYACRAGTKTPFHFGQTITGKLVNYDSGITYAQERKVKREGKTTSVGTYPPNAFGLYDMHGNVWEWCEDHWHDNYEGAPTDGSAWISGGNDAGRVRRGGSWDSYPRDCRSATRDFITPGYRSDYFGFRVVCEIPRTP